MNVNNYTIIITIRFIIMHDDDDEFIEKFAEMPNKFGPNYRKLNNLPCYWKSDFLKGVVKVVKNISTYMINNKNSYKQKKNATLWI